ncbi:MAG: F0F1 ATP synthase subunit A [Deltaproteobacteria bacterium]|nr:F0F1 ATP synthase subunit A [Deltaproteobacteria bacterium]
MPDHSTWFSFIIPSDLLANFRNAVGLSFINHTPVTVQYVLNFAFVAIVLLILVLMARGRIARVEEALVPDGKFSLRSFFEAMIEGTLSTMEGIMDRKSAMYFLPLIGTCALIIFFSNFLGLIPGFLPPTSNLSTTAAMALVIFITTHIYGVKEHGFIKYMLHFCGPLRHPLALPLMILMFCIEIISHFARPLSLSVRLMGNMYADHAVVGGFLTVSPIILPVAPLVLGVVVCIVQTAVFCILSSVYIGGAVAHEEH